MRVKDLDPSFRFLTLTSDVKMVNEAISAQCDECLALYVESREGHYTRVYGVARKSPLDTDQVHPHKEAVGVLM